VQFGAVSRAGGFVTSEGRIHALISSSSCGVVGGVLARSVFF